MNKERRPQYVGQIGKLEPFDESLEHWESYNERMINFFEENEIPENKQVCALISLLGANTYKILTSLVAPEKPKDKSLDDLCKTLKFHFLPKTPQIAERFRFYERIQ